MQRLLQDRRCSITKEQYDAIGRAAQRWNAFIGREHFKIEQTGTCRIYVHEVPDKREARYFSEAGYGEASIQIAPQSLNRSTAAFEAVVLHELGHSEEEANEKASECYRPS